jgi:hypothetical protein
VTLKKLKIVVTAPTEVTATEEVNAATLTTALTGDAEEDEGEVTLLKVVPRKELQVMDAVFPGSANKFQRVQTAIHKLAQDRTPANELAVSQASRAYLNAILKSANLQISSATFATEPSKVNRNIENLDSIAFGSNLGWERALELSTLKGKTATTPPVRKDQGSNSVEAESTQQVPYGPHQPTKERTAHNFNTVRISFKKNL